MMKRKREWRKVDLHIHTPASRSCYADPTATYLQILQKAEERNLDIVAFTDHNTVAGYATMRTRIGALEMLEQLDRLRPEERQELQEYRRLLAKILVLPGFELTATLGFHVLGIFSEQVSVRELEHILLHLKVPSDKLDEGSSEVGATVDVLTAYRIIAEAGGLVIAAHANSAHGVAMLGYDFGGQTKIAYTQDPNLHAIELTDLDSNRRRKRSTVSFFSGAKPEYPRRMHCIQGSDAHRLLRDPKDKTLLGVGDRITEVLLPEVSFAALREVFLHNDFSRTRPFRPAAKPFDPIQAAREQGANIVQAFHESASRQRGRLTAILRDIVAFANTNGGTIYVGVSANPRAPVVGMQRSEEVVNLIRSEIQRAISPSLELTIDVQKSDSKDVISLVVPKGSDAPYALNGAEIYVRQESQTSLAVRDEIIALVKQLLAKEGMIPPAALAKEEEAVKAPVESPRTGVEILDTVERKGVAYHTLKDLRNGNIVRDVTRSSARRLWRYAISQQESGKAKPEEITWQGNIGLWRQRKWAGRKRYDLVQRDAEGKLHVYYGVTEDGIHGEWRRFVEAG